jgi:putative spermidine/putrescine transport system ATP-binding protein
LLMDEPLGALDKKLRGHMQSEIKRLQAELGATVIYVTHDQEEALTMSDRIAVMQSGRIAQIGTPSELYERPATRWIADFVGESNFLEGVGQGGAIRLRAGGLANAARRLLEGEPAVLVIRPEKFRLAPPSDAAGHDRLAGTVRERVYLGNLTRHVVELADGSVVQVEEQNRAGGEGFGPGSRVTLHWAPADAWALPTAGAP